jgi:hypothetical protein
MGDVAKKNLSKKENDLINERHTPTQTTPVVVVVWASFRATFSCWWQEVGIAGGCRWVTLLKKTSKEEMIW